MKEPKTLEGCYDECLAEGNIIELEEIPFERIRTLIMNAEQDIAMITQIKSMKEIPHNILYKLNYEAIHALIQAFLFFDKIKSRNHHCLFAYLCIKHPELDLDWNFFEKIRTKRNGIYYYGDLMNKNDWKEIELQSEIYIRTLRSEIEKRLS